MYTNTNAYTHTHSFTSVSSEHVIRSVDKLYDVIGTKTSLFVMLLLLLMLVMMMMFEMMFTEMTMMVMIICNDHMSE